MVGWDIGGVNIKVALVAGGDLRAVVQRPFELQRAPGALVALLRELAWLVGAGASSAHAVTMTAELSQMFRTKREGVHFVLDAVEAAFPGASTSVFTVGGRFVSMSGARRRPLEVAAANWAATASLVARRHDDALLVDVGTTTTDIVPIVGGRVAATGRTDPERLASKELVYSGALRTPVEAIAREVPVRGTMTGVSAEGFALIGDVHLWRGDLAEADYTVTAPDARPATREFAGERLARMVCADRDLLDERDISAIADFVARAQVQRTAEAMTLVASRHPSLRTAVVTGLGSFIGHAAAHVARLVPVRLSEHLGHDGARCAPAAAVALLLTTQERAEADDGPDDPSVVNVASGAHGALVDVVVKLGGGVLAHPACFEALLARLGTDLAGVAALVVPGGGPFADAVRSIDDRLRLDDDEAHWMAVLGMEQYAQLIASRLAGGQVVETLQDIADAISAGRVPVLAPFRWMKEADPLPHTWRVTSDSIAAWVAGATGARQLVLIKPPGAPDGGLVDDHFDLALPPVVKATIVAADEIDALGSALAAFRCVYPRPPGRRR